VSLFLLSLSLLYLAMHRPIAHRVSISASYDRLMQCIYAVCNIYKCNIYLLINFTKLYVALFWMRHGET